MPKKRTFKNDPSKASAMEVDTVTTDLSFREVTDGKEVEKVIRVKTYGSKLVWRKVLCPTDNALVDQKRDKFHKRSDLELRLKGIGGFLYAVCWADSVKGAPALLKARGVVQCSLCGTWHNRAVFYKSLDGNRVLGHSGVDCLIDIMRSLNIPNVEAVAKAAKEESLRIDKYRKIMAKINDFKADFPGLYEHRDWLKSYDNPYSRIWWELVSQIGAGNGVDEKYLEACESGDMDRLSRRRWGRGRLDQAARRIPTWLQEVSQKTHDNGGNLPQEKLREELYEMSYNEDSRSTFRKERPSAAPVQSQPSIGATGIGGRVRQPIRQPQSKPQTVVPPVPAKLDDDIIVKAKELKKGGYDWSEVVDRAAKGEVLTKRQKEFIEKAHKSGQKSLTLAS